MSESSFHDWLRARARPIDRLLIPIGDDLAGLRNYSSNAFLLVGADQVLDGVHFDLKTHDPKLIGRKAMNRNLSDCAAMACLPWAAVATLALPRGAGEALARAIVEGMEEAGAAFDCPLVGGDTGSWDGPLAISVTILGRDGNIRPVQRSGARPGDKLYVTGPLGGSILGRHLTFEPRVKRARGLATHFDLHAMLDLSDGLSRDLPRLCAASGVGATIDASCVPIHSDARHLAGDPLDHALHDGEDYELLFACPMCDDPHVIEIGCVEKEAGVRVRDASGVRPLVPRGWEHSL
ncbi:MAG: thiamine-phosphate kinase [Tepidisphaeraceae bacterium]